MKKIAVDAMGGDYAPQAIVEGVNQALSDFSDIEVQLYGDEAKIKQYLTATERVSIIHTDEKIDSDDEPMRAIRNKKNASMVLAAKAVKDGKQTLSFRLGIQVPCWQQDSSSWVVSRISTVLDLCQHCRL
ncbi:fatty acid/phospholipid synthesis protein [Streptococcus pneumoniae]|nr:fatty acid/phospholipid synthesis protein [Streptococcus pneumoniae]